MIGVSVGASASTQDTHHQQWNEDLSSSRGRLAHLKEHKLILQVVLVARTHLLLLSGHASLALRVSAHLVCVLYQPDLSHSSEMVSEILQTRRVFVTLGNWLQESGRASSRIPCSNLFDQIRIYTNRQ